MTIIEQIKTEIEGWLREYAEDSQFELGKRYGYKKLLSFFSTIESEKPMQEGLEEEIERYLHSLGVGYGGWVDGMDDDDLRGIARHFAQWGAEHLADARKTSSNDLEEAADESWQYGPDEGIYDEYSPFYKDGFIAGAKWDREQMMKGAIPCKVFWHDGPLLDYTQEQQDNALERIGAHIGDKVKVIIVKEG